MFHTRSWVEWVKGVRNSRKLKKFSFREFHPFVELVTPRFHQEPLLPLPQREKREERGSEREHERQRGHLIGKGTKERVTTARSLFLHLFGKI